VAWFEDLMAKGLVVGSGLSVSGCGCFPGGVGVVVGWVGFLICG